VGKTVNVTRVTLEYAFEGKLFTVDFPDPSKIESIVFSKIDLERLQKQQKVDTAKAIVERKINPGMAFPLTAGNTDTVILATIDPTGKPTDKANGTASRSLWWHSSSCSWLHPEEDE
jgi:hypothetical protein